MQKINLKKTTKEQMLNMGWRAMDEYCIVKQRAGPLVKAFATDRSCFLRKNGECIRSRCGPAMSRTTVDKLELRLALL